MLRLVVGDVNLASKLWDNRQTGQHKKSCVVRFFVRRLCYTTFTETHLERTSIMTTIDREFVASLAFDDLIQIIKDQEVYEKQGWIGECMLRKKTEELMTKIYGENIGYVGDRVTTWMTLIVSEVYRRIAYEHIQKISA